MSTTTTKRLIAILLLGAVALAASGASAAARLAGPVVGIAVTPTGGGYWLTATDGGVFTFGNAPFFGSMGGRPLNRPVVGIARTPSGRGYRLAAGDGGVFAFGDASFHGSMAGQPLNGPVVGIAATPTGGGYWLTAADGGVFAFGDAAYLGGMAGRPLNGPVTGIAATPSGRGYWLTAADGGVFAFGDAAYLGGMAGRRLNGPVVGIAATPTGGGYWLTAADGGVFAFGDAAYLGGMAGRPLNGPVTGIAATPSGRGYWLSATDGGVFSFGDAAFMGSAASAGGGPEPPARVPCRPGSRARGARVQLWRDAGCRGQSVRVGTRGDDDRPDFTRFQDLGGQVVDVNDSISSLALAPRTCVRLFEEAGYQGLQSELVCAGRRARYLDAGGLGDRASSLRVCRSARRAACSRNGGAGRTVRDHPPGTRPPGSRPAPRPAPRPGAAAPEPEIPLPPPGAPPAPDPGTGIPPPSSAPDCNVEVRLLKLVARATCFRLVSGVYVAQGRIRVAGLDIDPQGSGEVRLDPRTLEITATGAVEVRAGSVVLYRGALDWKAGGPITVGVAGEAKLRGLPLKGEATVRLYGDRAEIDVVAGLPSVLKGVTGQATLELSVAGGLSPQSLELRAAEAQLGRLRLRDLLFSYSQTGAGDRWLGGATVVLPSPSQPEITGSVIVLDGAFKGAGARVNGLNKPMSAGVFLQRIHFAVEVRPFALEGGMGVSAGPRVLGKEAMSVDGSLRFTDGEPAIWNVRGKLKLVDLTLAQGHVAYSTNGSLDFSGELDFERFGVGVSGRVGGWIAGASAFNAEGRARVKMGFFSEGGEALISSRGLSACRSGFGPDVGFGYEWGGRPTIFASSCNVGGWRVSRPRGAAANEQTFRLGGGRLAAFAAAGTTAAPRVRLEGPRGERVSTPVNPAGVVNDGRFLLFRNPADRTTYVAVENPSPGAWRLVREPGSAPVTAFRQAAGLPRVSVRARVGGKGRRRVLRYRLRGRRGATVRFVERAGRVTRVLGTARGARGRIRFSPAPAGARRRRVVASVEREGVPADSFTVARYRAAPLRRPSRPRRVRLSVRRGRLAVRWGPARGARRYEVRVALRDGRRLLRTVGRQRRVTVRGVSRRDRPLVTVRAIGRAERPGRAVRVRYRVRR